MNISKLYGKPVVCADGGRGYVLSVYEEDGNISCLNCADEEEREFVLPADDITSFKGGIKFRGKKRKRANGNMLRIGRGCFDERGNYLGKLNEINFTGKKLISIKVGSYLFPVDCAIFGDVIIIKRTPALKEDVIKDGKVIIKKETNLDEKTQDLAASAGEYVQARLKSLD